MNEEDNSTVTEITVAPAEIAVAAKELTPVAKIENGLSDFLSHTFQMVQEEDEFKKQIQAELIQRLPTLKNTELISLGISQSTNQNDMLSKIVSPTMQLLTAAQQAEMAKQQKEAQNVSLSQTNIRELNTQAPTEVLTGMRALMELLRAVQTTPTTTEPTRG
jgi:ABC-type uncharacterized transport system YnjBCD ATPase subunit